MTNEKLVELILEKVGGRDNVTAATNCMTRLRIDVKDDSKIDEEALKALEGIVCKPAMANGKPCAVKFRYPVRFTVK